MKTCVVDCCTVIEGTKLQHPSQSCNNGYVVRVATMLRQELQLLWDLQQWSCSEIHNNGNARVATTMKATTLRVATMVRQEWQQ